MKMRWDETCGGFLYSNMAYTCHFRFWLKWQFYHSHHHHHHHQYWSIPTVPILNFSVCVQKLMKKSRFFPPKWQKNHAQYGCHCRREFTSGCDLVSVRMVIHCSSTNLMQTGQYSAELRTQRFPVSQYGVHPPSWIFSEVKFYHTDISVPQFSIRIQNLVQKSYFRPTYGQN